MVLVVIGRLFRSRNCNILYEAQQVKPRALKGWKTDVWFPIGKCSLDPIYEEECIIVVLAQYHYVDGRHLFTSSAKSVV